MAGSHDWEFLVVKQEVRFSDEGGVSPPRLEEHQVVEPWERPYEETYKIEKRDAYEDPNIGQKEQALPFLTPVKIFKPPKREAARGELSGYTKPVRGRKHAMTTMYYARNKGIRGICCCEEIINEGEDVIKYEPHLTGLPWALREYTVLCGGCRNDIWEITCPARCAICGPTLHNARAQAATSSTRAQTALSTGGKTEGRASRERTREDIPPTWTHTTQPARIRERRNQPSRRKHAQTRRKMKGYRQRAYAQMKGQPLTHVRSDERAPQASARPTASYPANTHEPVGPLIDKRHRRMQVQTRKPNSAAAPTRPLLRLLCDHWRSPSPTPSKPTATVRLSYLNRRLDHPSGGYPFPSPSRRRFSDDPSNESITAAHRHGIVHGRISRCETLTIECRYSLFPSLQSTSCSGINLGGCPFDSRHGQDRPEERVALPEPRDSQVTDLSSQAPACSSNERSTYAASSDEFVVLRQRDLPRQQKKLFN
ncbi:unnamed protein product [Trichogramma brassicae]|uniref:Uncharacterized protein n=1 Tax=Trichogramma brassicae TaxID=86971 RepID=A0A6H5IA43_9HYME|nr:unnamed protein product [Trichogramma brassicae]